MKLFILDKCTKQCNPIKKPYTIFKFHQEVKSIDVSQELIGSNS